MSLAVAIGSRTASSSAPVRTAKPPGERPVTLTLRRVVAAPRHHVASLLLSEWQTWTWLSAQSVAPMHVLPPADAAVPRTECGHVAAGATRVVVRQQSAPPLDEASRATAARHTTVEE